MPSSGVFRIWHRHLSAPRGLRVSFPYGTMPGLLAMVSAPELDLAFTEWGVRCKVCFHMKIWTRLAGSGVADRDSWKHPSELLIVQWGKWFNRGTHEVPRIPEKWAYPSWGGQGASCRCCYRMMVRSGFTGWSSFVVVAVRNTLIHYWWKG